MGKNLKRQKRPNPEKVQIPHSSPKLGRLWIFDVAGKSTYYPKDQESFNRTYNRLTSEKRELKTSQ